MSAVPANVDVSIPDELHTAHIDHRASRFAIGRDANGNVVHHQVVSDATNLMTRINKSANNLMGAERAVKAVRDPAASQRLKRGAESELKTARKSIDDTLTAITGHHRAVSEEIDNELRIPLTRSCLATAGRAADVRAHLRSLGASERRAAMESALVAGDIEAVSAVLSASPLASSMTPGEMKLLRMGAENKFTKDKAALRDNMEELGDFVARAGRLLFQRFGGLIGEGDTAEARAERALRDLESKGGAA